MKRRPGDYEIIVGDARKKLRELPAGSARTCITSPPYWGLRDYGMEGQIGLEATPDAFVQELVEIFREVRRVLADDGTLWLNLGDSYAAAPGGGTGKNSAVVDRTASRIGVREACIDKSKVRGFKPKDLIGIPWRVAFALQADGWYLRSDIIWHKPNPMPESVLDRPTKAHEYLFLLSKSEKYFYDCDAIREPLRPKTFTTYGSTRRSKGTDALGQVAADNWSRDVPVRRAKVDASGNPVGVNKRTVWTVATRPFEGAHFATYPPELIEPCVLAGSTRGDLVLDPFNGAGTTGLVALRHGRRYLGVEINPEYAAMARARIDRERAAGYQEAML